MNKIIIGEGDALVAVDMQNDFCHSDGALYVAGVSGEATMPEVIEKIEQLANLDFGYLAKTFDEHPGSGHVEFGIYGPHVIEGTLGAKYVSELAILDYLSDFDLTKGGDRNLISYSAAVSEAWGNLIGCLRSYGIRRIFVCGVAYTHCAGETAISFAVQNVPVGDASWEVFIVRDATRSVPPPYGDPGLMAKKLVLYGVKEVSCSDLGIV
ncbi:MAG TPA: isochorismatase family protein [Candidatus Paceibacterota bacterium]